MANFNQVSLGFAEFVSQILHETFEATLSAQNHQLEKYLELENSLKLSKNRFKELFLTDDSLLEREQDIFGVRLEKSMVLSNDTISTIELLSDDSANIISGGKLTQNGFDKLKEIVLDNLVEERKNLVQEIINKTEMTRLIVDSGEVRAKLELSNLSESFPQSQPEEISKTKDSSEEIRTVSKENIIATDQILETNLPSKLIQYENVRINDIRNSETNERTLLIDKSSISNNTKFESRIPSVRIVAKPAAMSSNTNLLSEIIIKFRVV